MYNYTIIHSHTTLSNPTTTMDSVTHFNHYIDKAKECGMKAIAFTEHGNIFEWLHKKEAIEKAGMKYIHGVEAYITKSPAKKARDNYHCILIAKNYDGFLELNTLISRSFNRAEVKTIGNEVRFYYVPRITYEELKNTSDNIIITTACLGGVLGSDDIELKKDFIEFLTKNKHRAFLEVQHHNILQQAEYNKLMYKIHKKTGIRLIAGTDTHSLNAEHADGRDVLQKAKNTHFDNEEGWDLTFKTYNELVKAYDKQNALPKEVYLKAIENTNLLANMVEEFEVDRSHKYPKLYNNSEEVFKKKILKGIKDRNVSLTDEIKRRINHEFSTMKNNGSIDYMLLEEDIKNWCRENGIEYGYSRGSVSGSYIAYLLKITEMDSIKHKLNFERFQNPERVSLCDVDTDFPPSQRDAVRDYVYNKKNVYCADIITFNTIAKKGAIRDVGRAFKIPLKEVDDISKQLDNNEEELRKKYPKLFKYVDLLNGVVVSIGSHPAGVIVSPITLHDNVGLCTLKDSDKPVTQLNMKEIDSLNYVKLDLLGLDNIEVINETCKLAEIERLTPDNLNIDDEKVWKSIRKSSVGIFQWESESAWAYYKKLFSDETLAKIKKDNPNFNYIDLFSIGNGAIRPAGESYRDALANGEFKDNGHSALNEFLKPTRGFLVFQEQIIEFLNKFCGFTMGEADIVRRGFAKKTGTEQYIPKIKKGFIKTMKEKYNLSQEKSEKLIVNFIEVIEAASDYLFSLNHSASYSYIGYACAWLRYYYPLEFLTVMLNVNEDKEKKTAKIIDYINKFTNIQIKPIKFRYSHAEYNMDKESNSIYKGLSSVKYMNHKIAEELYELGKNQYNNFAQLLKDITEKTSVDSKQLDILIKLDFFSEFGKSKKLLDFVKYFNLISNAKVINKQKIEEDWLYQVISENSRETKSQFRDLDNDKILDQIWNRLLNIDLTLPEKIQTELDYLGYINYTNPNLDKRYVLITSLNTRYTPILNIYCLNNGKTETVKISKKSFSYEHIKEGTILYINSMKRKHGWKKVGEHKNGKPKFEPDHSKQQWWVTSYSIVNNIDSVIEEATNAR